MAGINSFSQLPPRNIDPDTYAQQYANQNGISLEEAKSQLRATHGDPVKQEGSIFNQSSTGNGNNSGVSDLFDILNENEEGTGSDLMSFLTQLLEKFTNLFNGESEDEQNSDEDGFTLTGDPEKDAQSYADIHNITLDEAKAELKKLHGEPAKKDENSNENNPFFTGNPEKDAQAYADLKGITLEEAKAELEKEHGAPKAQN